MKTDIELWYWQYVIEICDEDGRRSIRAGIVTGYAFSDAAAAIENYYYKELIEIKSLKAITDGIFDFCEVMNGYGEDFDFKIVGKDKYEIRGDDVLCRE